VGRYYAARMSRELGEAIFVENRIGAGGNVGTLAVAKAPPDGYTIALGNAATHGMNATYYANPGYDPVDDFVPIGMLGVTNVALGVSPKLGVRTLGELVAKSKTERINIALPSTTALLVNDIMVRRGGSAMTGVPYKGAPAALNDFLGGHVHAMIDSATAVQQQVAAGTMVAIGVASGTPSELLPGVRTLAEQGLPGFEVPGWFALFAPHGTPPEIVQRLNAALRKVREDPDSRRQLMTAGIEPLPVGEPAALPGFVRSERDKFAKLIRDARLKAE
jgi:tripartite-type tricarboxylate transporter receptor subunit TctC